jgi:hypothetical protein
VLWPSGNPSTFVLLDHLIAVGRLMPAEREPNEGAYAGCAPFASDYDAILDHVV